MKKYGRPFLPPGKHRVSLSVRVTPETKAAIRALSKHYGNLGRAIDGIIQDCEGWLPTDSIISYILNKQKEEKND